MGYDATLKCYAVHAEEASTLVFAKKAVVARREGANELNVEFEDVECRRAPWGDDYQSTGVPVELAIEQGWWFECWDCGHRINSDSVDDDELSPVGFVTGRVFCTPACERAFAVEKADRKLAERFGVAVMRHKLGAMAGGKLTESKTVLGPHVYSRSAETGAMQIQEMAIAFTFPGAKHGGRLSWDDKDDRGSQRTGEYRWRASVSRIDIDAYHALTCEREAA